MKTMNHTATNAQATHHLGVIAYDESETPIGVNFFGLTFEDACYSLATENGITHRRFEREVTRAMRSGRNHGTFLGKTWAYVGARSCHASDAKEGAK